MIAPFYKKWNEKKFKSRLDQFGLSPKMKVGELSKGMKIKFSLALALSHEAELFIMDEPTSGLDPVFRRELLEMLAEIMQDERNTIFYSTHITSDLDRIADYIAFIDQGKLIFNDTKENILDKYVLVKGDRELLDSDIRNSFIGLRETAVGFEGLSADRQQSELLFGNFALMEKPSLEDIMYFTTKGAR